MLERLGLEKAMRLSGEQAITVISRRSASIREYILQRYDGYCHKRECHMFEVRDSSGEVMLISDEDLGLRGNQAIARFAAPEGDRSSAVAEPLLRETTIDVAEVSESKL
jgi:hypothetical protein